MPDPTTTPDPLLPIPEVTEPEAPRQPKKAAERITDLEAQLAAMNETAAQNAARAVEAEAKLDETADRIRTIERNLDGFARGLDEKLGPLLARLGASPEDVQKAIDTTPARQVGNLMLDDRMSEAEILERVRAIRSGKLAPDKATRFRTDARIYPDKDTPLHARHAGTTIPLRTEVTRADFSPESLDHHIATGALIPIA
jgi:hypothetical protein